METDDSKDKSFQFRPCGPGIPPLSREEYYQRKWRCTEQQLCLLLESDQFRKWATSRQVWKMRQGTLNMLLSTFALFFFVINLVSLKSLLESQHPSTPENKVALGASLQPVSAVVCNLGSYRYAVSGVRQLLYLERLRIVRFVRHKATDKDVTMKMQMKNQHSMHVKICLQQNGLSSSPCYMDICNSITVLETSQPQLCHGMHGLARSAATIDEADTRPEDCCAFSTYNTSDTSLMRAINLTSDGFVWIFMALFMFQLSSKRAALLFQKQDAEIIQLEHTMVSVTIPPEACGSSLMRQMHNDGIYRLRQPVRDHLEYLALLLAAQPPQAFCLLSFFNTCLAKCLPVAALLKECCLQLQGRPQQDRALCETEGKMEFPAAQCGSEAAVREIDGSDLVFGNLIAEAPEDVVRHLNLQLSVLRDLAEKLHHCRKAMQEKLSTVVGSQEQIAGILDSVAMISDQVLFSSASTVNRLLDSGNISAGASHAHTMPSKALHQEAPLVLDTLQKTNSKNEEMSPGDQGIQEAPDCFPKDRQRQSELSVSNTAVLSVNFLSGLSQHQAAVSKSLQAYENAYEISRNLGLEYHALLEVIWEMQQQLESSTEAQLLHCAHLLGLLDAKQHCATAGPGALLFNKIIWLLEAFKASEKERLNLSSQLHDVCKSHSSLVDELSGISAMNSTLQGELWGTRHQVEDLSRQIQLLEQSVIDLQMEVCKMTVELQEQEHSAMDTMDDGSQFYSNSDKIQEDEAHEIDPGNAENSQMNPAGARHRLSNLTSRLQYGILGALSECYLEHTTNAMRQMN